MVDEVQKDFIRSVVNFLRQPRTLQSLTSDCKESVDVAIQCLQTAFEIENGDSVETKGMSGKSNESESISTENAIDIFEMFQSVYIERNPQSLQVAETIKNDGNRLMKEGKYNEALLQYNRAISFDPKNSIYYCNRAAAYIRLGYNDHAVTDCKTALLYNPSYSKAFGRLGIAYSNLRKYSEAQQAYEKAIELEPDNQDYHNNLQVARDASQSCTSIPQITEGLNTMLSAPGLRNIFNNTEIDMEQLQILTQNPIVMNAVSQLFSGMQTSVNSTPLLPNGMLQLFQTFANQLSTSEDSTSNEGCNDPPHSHQAPP